MPACPLQVSFTDPTSEAAGVIVMMRFLFCALCCLVSPLLPVPLFAFTVPRRRVPVADALLGYSLLGCSLFASSLPALRLLLPTRIDTISWSDGQSSIHYIAFVT
jgi:hypothetical protein